MQESFLLFYSTVDRNQLLIYMYLLIWQEWTWFYFTIVRAAVVGDGQVICQSSEFPMALLSSCVPSALDSHLVSALNSKFLFGILQLSLD